MSIRVTAGGACKACGLGPLVIGSMISAASEGSAEGRCLRCGDFDDVYADNSPLARKLGLRWAWRKLRWEVLDLGANDRRLQAELASIEEDYAQRRASALNFEDRRELWSERHEARLAAIGRSSWE